MRHHKRKKRSKAEVEKQHFIRRCLERLGRNIKIKEIVAKIQNNELELYERQSNRVTKWRYEIDGIPYIVVYDKNRQQLITLLYDYERMKECLYSTETQENVQEIPQQP